MAGLPHLEMPPISEVEAETRLRTDRHDMFALISKADHRFLNGDHRAANSFYTAITRAPSSISMDPALLQRARTMADWLAEKFKDHMLQSLDSQGFHKTARHPRFQKSLEIMLGLRERSPVTQRYPQMPLLYFYPDLPYTQFADPAAFAWRAPLESAFSKMRQEAESLLEAADDFRPYIKTNTMRPQGDVHGMLENSDWSTLHLFENGAPVAEHVEKCPVIFETVMQNVPLCRIGPRAPSVMLSLLKPYAKIPPHTGMLNCRFVCHLPLIIPPECGFRVGQESREWQEGKLLVFDDTVEHEAWNNSNQNRLVLIFDVWRPELSSQEQAMVQALFHAVDSYS
jgi:aspartyl/asparaginyl beta-hydroxylase (cupin superfamily)